MDEDDYEDINKIDDNEYESSSIKTTSSSDDASSSDIIELDQYGDPVRKYKSLYYEDIYL